MAIRKLEDPVGGALILRMLTECAIYEKKTVRAYYPKMLSTVMDAMAELNRYAFEPAVKAQVAGLLQALTAELAAKDIKIAALTHELAYYKPIRFGQKTEALAALQRDLFREDVETDLAAIEAELESLKATPRSTVAAPRSSRRGRQPLPDHLPRIAHRHEPQSCTCGQCGNPLSHIRDDVTEQLDVEPAKFFVHRHIRPQYACRSCETVIAEAVPPAIIDGGLAAPLSNPTGGATVGTSSTTVWIEGAYATVVPPFDTALTIRREWGVILSWVGGGELQRADRVTGPWHTLLTATNLYTVQSPVPTTFYRVTRPRAVSLYIPWRYTGQTNLPLVVLLHGYGGNGADYESLLQFQSLAEGQGFLYCYPGGTVDRGGKPFWNATDDGCDFWNTGVDDAGYLRTLIEEIGRRFSVDPKRIFLFGHSNGGRMAYRMACQSADLIAGIASLAGMMFLDPSRCGPSAPVHPRSIRQQTLPLHTRGSPP